jgi:hypothetical protein
MNEEPPPIIPTILGVLGVLYFGYELNRRRTKLRRIFSTFDREESAVADVLEQFVVSGRLKPYFPGPTS